MHTSEQQAPLAGASATSSTPATEPPMTLATLIELYMANYAGRDRTRACHLAAWDSLLGDLPFASITDDDVFKGLAQISAEPARIYLGKDGDGAPIHRGKAGTRSSATVNRYHAALSAVFTWAIKKRRAPRAFENPCHKVERGPETAAVVRFLSDAELERLLEACKASSWSRLYLLVLMALTTGARRGELLALTLGDVDLERGLAHIKSSKNDQPRALPLVPVVLEELKRLPIARPEACVFPSRAQLDKPRAFQSSWFAALERARIRRFRFHDLRHTCASYLAQNGASLLEIADVMGHRQLAMVKRYAHLTTDTKARLVNRVLGGIK